jgi:hypothetical protein
MGSILAKVFLIRPRHLKQGIPRLYEFLLPGLICLFFFLSLLDTVDVRHLLIPNFNRPANGNPCMATEQPMGTPYFTLAAQLERPKQGFFRVVRSSMLHDHFQPHT